MDKFKEIRPIVLGIAKRNGRVLASLGYDKVKDRSFYRAIGGGIEFLEKSDEALKREFKEEIGAEVTIGNFLGVVENIFTFEGQNGHEIIFLYEVHIDEKDVKPMYYEEGDTRYPIEWVDIKALKDGSKIIYPTDVVKYL